MRQTDQHRRRREQFMSDVLVRALEKTASDVTVLAGGSPNGADLVTATLAAIEVDGRTVGKGFSVLFEDREDNAKATRLDRVSTKWRDDMLHARATSNVDLVSQDDARRVLELGLESLARELKHGRDVLASLPVSADP